MPTTLYLVLFTQHSMFPQDTAHWGLYLENELAGQGTFFHASKDSMDGTTRYVSVPNMRPTRSRSLRSAVIVKSGSNITDTAVDTACRAAAQGRKFDLIVNNCQRFVTQVLQRLVNAGQITQAEFNALAAKGFTPLV